MYCAIIGDIVHSKHIDIIHKEAIKARLEETLRNINVTYMDYILADFGLVRGDAFEGVLFSNVCAPFIIRNIIKSMYKTEKTKIKICVVTDTLDRVSTERNDADGPAFHRANEEIKNIPKATTKQWMQISFITNTIAQPIINSYFRLLSALTSRWTSEQTRTVWTMEDHAEMIDYFINQSLVKKNSNISEQQKLAGKQLGIAPSSINRQIQSTNFNTYQTAWDELVTYLEAEEDRSADDNGYTAYYSIGNRFMHKKDYMNAIKYYKLSINMARVDVNVKDPVNIILYNKLTEAYIKINDVDNAKLTINQIHNLHKNTNRACLQLSKTYILTGDLSYENQNFQEATENYQKALNTTIGLYKEGQFYQVICKDRLARVYYAAGEYDAALAYYYDII